MIFWDPDFWSQKYFSDPDFLSQTNFWLGSNTYLKCMIMFHIFWFCWSLKFHLYFPLKLLQWLVEWLVCLENRAMCGPANDLRWRSDDLGWSLGRVWQKGLQWKIRGGWAVSSSTRLVHAFWPQWSYFLADLNYWMVQWFNYRIIGLLNCWTVELLLLNS